MAHDVFISYSADDKSVADAMCSMLESNGLQCWMAPRDILPGMDWGGSIIDAIAGTRVMVLVLSSHSNTSSQVKREVERAVNKDVIVIPFRIEDVTLSKSLEYQLSSTHWMDAITPPLADHLQTLAERIKQILSTDSPAVPPVTKAPRPPIQPIQPVIPFYKRRAVFLSAPVLIVLLAVVSVAWLMIRRNSTTEPAVSQSTGSTPTPIATSPLNATSTPRNEQPTTQPTPSPNRSPGPSPSVVASPPSGELAVPKIYGKSYHVARKLLLKEGWQPNERLLSYGRDPATQEGNGPTFWKRGYHELVTCSGSAAAECLFEFFDTSNRILVVVTAGEEDENGAYHATVKRTVFKQKQDK
jgi:hypothetical protein